MLNKQREKDGLSPLTTPADTSESDNDDSDSDDGAVHPRRDPPPASSPSSPGAVEQGESLRVPTRRRSARPAPSCSSGARTEPQQRTGGSDVALDAADDSTLGGPGQRQGVTGGDRNAASTAGELARVHALGGDRASSRGSRGSRVAPPSNVSKKRKLSGVSR